MVKTIVSGEGLEFYRSQIEHLVTPSLRTKGMDLAAVRSAIRDHTPDSKQHHLLLFEGATWNDAHHAMMNYGVSRGLGVAHFCGSGTKDGKQAIIASFYSSDVLEDLKVVLPDEPKPKKAEPKKEKPAKKDPAISDTKSTVFAGMTEAQAAEMKKKAAEHAEAAPAEGEPAKEGAAPEAEAREEKELAPEKGPYCRSLEKILVSMLDKKRVEFEDPFQEVAINQVFDAAMKGKTEIGSALIDEEVAVQRELEISTYYAKKERTGDVKKDFDVLFGRIVHREWADLFNTSIGDVIGGEEKAKPVFTAAFQRAAKRAYVLMPDAFESRKKFEELLKQDINFKKNYNAFRQMFMPGAYLSDMLKGIRVSDGLICGESSRIIGREDAEGKPVPGLRDTLFDAGGDSFGVFRQASMSIETIKQATLAEYIRKPWECTDEDKYKAVEAIYYTALSDLQGKVATRLKSEIAALQEQKQQKSASDSTPGWLEEGNEELQAIERQIAQKQVQLKDPLPDEDELWSAYQSAMCEMRMLLGKDLEHHLLNKDIKSLRWDYDRHVRTFHSVWRELAPLWQKYGLVVAANRLVPQKKNPRMSKEEFGKIKEAISKYKAKHNCVNEDAFKEIMADVRVYLQKRYLRGVNDTPDRYQYYEDLKKSLDDPEALKKAAAVKTQELFGRLITNVFRYLQDGMISKEKACNAFDRLRKEELARKFVFEARDDMVAALGEKEIGLPTYEHVAEMYYLASQKARALIPDFASAFEKDYELNNEGHLTEGGNTKLMYDHLWGMLSREGTVAKIEAKKWDEFVQSCAMPLGWIQLWSEIGEAVPSVEDFYERYRWAVVDFSTYAVSNLCPFSSQDEARKSLEAEQFSSGRGREKFRKHFRKEHLLRYESTISTYLRGLEEAYIMGNKEVPKLVIAQKYKPRNIEERGWMDNHHLKWLRRSISWGREKLPAWMFYIKN